MKYISLIFGLCLSLSSCVLKTEHDASLAAYKEKAQAADSIQSNHVQLQQQVQNLNQQISELAQRNQDLSNINQQLVQKNLNLTQSTLSGPKLALEQQKATQAQKNTYLTIYENMKRNLSDQKDVHLLLKDDYVGVRLSRTLFYAGSWPKISASGRATIQKIASTLDKKKDYTLKIEYIDTYRSIRQDLKKAYDGQLSLRALEAGNIAHAFKTITPIRFENLSTFTHVDTSKGMAPLKNDHDFILKFAVLK